MQDGYAHLALGNDDAVVFRTSALDRSLASAVVGLTSSSPASLANKNVAEGKGYAKLYKEVVSRIRVPAKLAEAIYRRHEYMTHFFDQSELEALVRRWSC